MQAESLFLAVARQVANHFGPTERAAKVTITTATGLKVRLDIPPISAMGSEKPQQLFVPTPFQKGILKALEGRGLKTTDLVQATGNDKRRLFRDPGGIQELVREKLVHHHERLGYYRPDAKPPELSGGKVKSKRWVYFIQAGDKGAIKIGKANSVKRRLAALQTSSSETLRVLGIMPCTRHLEGELHQKFSAHNIRGEWFKAHRELLDFISQNCSPWSGD